MFRLTLTKLLLFCVHKVQSQLCDVFKPLRLALRFRSVELGFAKVALMQRKLAAMCHSSFRALWFCFSQGNFEIRLVFLSCKNIEALHCFQDLKNIVGKYIFLHLENKGKNFMRKSCMAEVLKIVFYIALARFVIRPVMHVMYVTIANIRVYENQFDNCTFLVLSIKSVKLYHAKT